MLQSMGLQRITEHTRHLNPSLFSLSPHLCRRETGDWSRALESQGSLCFASDSIGLSVILFVCCVQLLSHVCLFATPSTVARWALLSMGFFRQEYWSGLPFPPPGNLSDAGIEPGSPALQADFFYHLSHQGSLNKGC